MWWFEEERGFDVRIRLMAPWFEKGSDITGALMSELIILLSWLIDIYAAITGLAL